MSLLSRLRRREGRMERGELGLQTRKSGPIAEFLQPAERLRSCSGSKNSVIYTIQPYMYTLLPPIL
jgi:hypothetical protein